MTKEAISLEEYGRRRRDLEQRQEALSEGAKQMERQVERTVELAELTASIEEFTARIRQGFDNAGFDQKRQLVELLIDRVVVSHEEVEIRYVVPTNKACEQIHFSHLRADYRAGHMVVRRCWGAMPVLAALFTPPSGRWRESSRGT